MDVWKRYLLAAALLATLIPAAFVLYRVGGPEEWRGVLPRGTTDSLYYYARIHEVLDGHPLNGNPFAYEHRNDIAPAQFIPDIISALPMLAGIPFNLGVLLNVFIWSAAFLLLAYILLRKLLLPPRYAAGVALVTYACCYTFMLRPTIMQQVYPVFFLFMLALVGFLQAPNSRRRLAALTAASVLSFYVYTFLAYIVVISMAVLFVWRLLERRWTEIRSLILMALCSAALLLPLGVHMYVQMSDPNYWATFSRIGLVHTRIPSIESFFFGRWIIVGLGALGLLWFAKREQNSPARMFWIATGGGLLGGLFLNVATNVELTLGVHVGRFVVPWMVLLLAWAAHEAYRGRPMWGTNKQSAAFVAAAFLLLLLTTGVARNVQRGSEFFTFEKRGERVADTQAYAGPLEWLEHNVSKESVVWSNDSIAQYLPVMTRHYPLYFEAQLLHSMSDEELLERYLLSRSLGTLSLEDLHRDLGIYAGVGKSLFGPLAQNQRAHLCTLLARVSGPRQCPPRTNSIALLGKDYFDRILAQFEEVKRNRDELLKKYHVSYMLMDRQQDQFSLPAAKPLYDNGRFAIVPL